MKLGSLFDGIGGALLSAEMCGIMPVWASEIEPFPIKVTEHHFPNVLHLGDITEIDGSKIEPVDIIVGGSPCQDLSVAGKRAGLGGERSGLFMEQIRIVKEMRDATNGFFPRYMVWENVAGAFSSNKGDDFRIVLEEIAKITEADVSIPRPNKRWAKAGSILGDGWSISWRTFDAQYWGVPQRRRRIYLVADFRGSTAPEILFEQPCVSGDITESRGKREGVAEDSEGGTGDAGFGEGDVDRCNCLTPWDNQSKRIFDPAGSYPTLQAMNGGGANNTAVFSIGGYHSAISYDMTHADDVIRDMGEVTQTLQHRLGTGGNQVPITMTYSYQRSDQLKESNVSCTQSVRQYKDATDLVVDPERTIRRLTPLECERLQGFPDNWTNIEGASDTARYKALGNSFAIPNILFVISRIKGA